MVRACTTCILFLGGTINSAEFLLSLDGIVYQTRTNYNCASIRDYLSDTVGQVKAHIVTESFESARLFLPPRS